MTGARRGLLIVAAAALGLGAGMLFTAWRAAPPESAAAPVEALVGQPRPPFTLGASDGRVVSAGDFDGRVLLLNFWATWCQPCVREMPMLDEIQQAYGARGLSVVGVALDDVARARTFAEDLGVAYTILVGAGDTLATGLAYGNRAGLLPYSVLVDREGVVRWTHIGELERSELEEQIEARL